MIDTQIPADRTYDASGLLCPMPVLRANRMLRELVSGQVLKVLATDPAAAQDFPSYCRQTGHELVSTGSDGARISKPSACSENNSGASTSAGYLAKFRCLGAEASGWETSQPRK